MDLEGYHDLKKVEGREENYSSSEVTEELMKNRHVTPEDILGLTSYTKKFLCPPSANAYGVEFVRFALRDIKTGEILVDLNSNSSEKNTNKADLEYYGVEEDTACQLFETSECSYDLIDPLKRDEHKVCGYVNEEITNVGDLRQSNEQSSMPNKQEVVDEGLEEFNDRHIQYNLPKEVLYSTTIGAIVEFKVGEKEIENLRMIELHFFKDKLLKKFEFDFGFCIPNSLNSWEHIYQIPELSPEMIQEIISSPYETRSETFYFANRTLIIHNKAAYSYHGLFKGDWD